MRLMRGVVFTVIFLTGVAAHADILTVGSLVYFNPITTGFQGFEVFNLTGPTDGCDATDAIPVCTVMALENTSLTVTLADSSTITRTPSGGFSFGPGGYIYGDNAGDDPAQSFLFDPALEIVSATFSGTATPGSFQVTDGTSQTTFSSNGLFSVPLDIPSGSPVASADITIDAAPVSAVPEPNFLVPGGVLMSLLVLRRRYTL
jgi:hypothetical protein